ncbi:hypothetical protein [Yinghuangia sp. YIM S09857]|uniref:hypothetical protein n=1 Tax=Yinghuangia sp. YIM S09857 TaxID=3436929 RepID=UPI003F539D83
MSTPDVVLASVAVRPGVVADIVEALPPRLRKRLDGAVDKLLARPITRDGDTVRIAVDDDADLTLNAPGGVVRTAEDVVCACLLAPSCLHRAAAVSALTVSLDDDPDDAPDDAAGAADAGPDPTVVDGPSTAETPKVGQSPGAGGRPNARAATTPLNPQVGGPDEKSDDRTATTPAQHAAAHTLWKAAALVLDAGIPGAGAVQQAELLRAAHSAKLAGLHRGAAAAVSVTTALRAARAEDPAHRLLDLAESLRELLDTADQLTSSAASAELLGTARQAYAHSGSLRLYGLFTEPLRTASGHAGVVTYTLGPDGALRTVSDVMPGTPDRIAGAAARAVRMGDTALDHHALTRAGLLVSGATESATGRLGAGASVRAVSASGAAWHAEPLAALWAEPPSVQVARVLRARELPADARRAGAELLFLDVEILGPIAASAASGQGDRVAARCLGTGTPVQLLVADDHPALAYRDNMRLIAGHRGLALRLIGRLEPGADTAVRVLAVAPAPTPDVPATDIPTSDTPTSDAAAPTPTPDTSTPDTAIDTSAPVTPAADSPAESPGHSPTAAGTPVLTLAPALKGRVNLGLDRLQRADFTGPAEHAATAGHTGVRPSPPPTATLAPPHTDEAPVYLVHRQVERAVAGGRPAVALAGTLARDTARLRRDGLSTGADLLEHLAASAADRGRDVFGRLLPADTDRLARAWLATAGYARAVDAALTARAWGPPGEL